MLSKTRERTTSRQIKNKDRKHQNAAISEEGLKFGTVIEETTKKKTGYIGPSVLKQKYLTVGTESYTQLYPQNAFADKTKVFSSAKDKMYYIG